LKPSIEISKFLFDDEAGFSIRAPPCYRKVLTSPKDERFEFKLADFHPTLFVWGCIGYGWKSKIVRLDGRVNAEVYRSILEENLIAELDKQNWTDKTFITDNAPWHTAKLVKDYLTTSNLSWLRPKSVTLK
jgi:hypothetical protein